MFLAGTIAYGVYSTRDNRTTQTYFLADRQLPWWAVMLSVVATETSVLTFISVPGIAYRGNWFFLQLAMGYIIGRILVSYILLPLYYAKGITSIYEFVGQRFGTLVQKVTSGVFLITRILADGVRFFATAMLVSTLLPLNLVQAVLLIGFVTLVYTLSGGIKAVVWMDSLQFILYLGAGLVSLVIIDGLITGGLAVGLEQLRTAGKLAIFNFSTADLLSISAPYGFIAALLGGAFLSFASHGVDYMMVQRLLSTKSLGDARRALIGSGFFVALQFSLFMLIGGLLWVVFEGQVLPVDQEYPRFIGNYLPVGLKGILLAGVLAAAMSTLSSSINSLAASTVKDWLPKDVSVRISRSIALFWGLVLMVVALSFTSKDSPVVILGLQIASYTYGGLLGLFLLGRTKRDYPPVALITSLLVAAVAVIGLKSLGVAWTWYIIVALAANLLTAEAVRLGLRKYTQSRSES
ncbi:sodium:solute symporter [Candidatus Neomarinimicrobiota bacterium]